MKLMSSMYPGSIFLLLSRLRLCKFSNIHLDVEEIQCPKTTNLSQALDVISILKALEVDYTGPVGAKKQKLKQECGLGTRQTS